MVNPVQLVILGHLDPQVLLDSLEVPVCLVPLAYLEVLGQEEQLVYLDLLV